MHRLIKYSVYAAVFYDIVIFVFYNIKSLIICVWGNEGNL